jgi:methylthioribose-1-phosphate isomerase
MIPVEERPPEEIILVGRQKIGPSNADVINPVFDITPAKYVSAIITEKGIIRPPYKKAIRMLLRTR